MPLGASGSHSGLLAGNEGFRPVMGIDGRLIDVPPHPKVGREPGRDPVVILHKQCVVPGAQVGGVGRVLLSDDAWPVTQSEKHIAG